MKKLLLGLVFAGAVSSASAEYLYWQVGASDVPSGSEYQDVNYAGIAVYENGSMERVKTLDLTAIPTGNGYTDLSSYSPSKGNYVFAIELYNYDGSSSTLGTAIAHNDAMTYTELANAGYLASNMAQLQSMTAFTGGFNNPGPAPEPTSGLMMLVGLAMLGLKRRRA